MSAAYRNALAGAGIDAEQVGAADLYSCFPIAVWVAMDALGITLDVILLIVLGAPLVCKVPNTSDQFLLLLMQDLLFQDISSHQQGLHQGLLLKLLLMPLQKFLFAFLPLYVRQYFYYLYE